MLDALRSMVPEFIFLAEEKKFNVAEFKSTPNSFGDFFLVLSSFDLQIKIYSDRGQRFVDVSPDNVHWHKLEYVLEFINPSLSSELFGSPSSFEILANLMKKISIYFLIFLNLVHTKFFLKNFKMIRKINSLKKYLVIRCDCF